MTLNQLTYFCALAKTKSYTQAARELFIAQPSLSYAISTLEKELGCLLVAREGRRIALTPAGETFYHYAKAALSRAFRPLRQAKPSIWAQSPPRWRSTFPG